MQRLILGLDAAQVALVGASIDFGVTVDEFPPKAAEWEADPVLGAQDGSEVKNHQHDAGAVGSLTAERKHALFMIGRIDPTKPFEVVIGLPESRLGTIEPV